MKHYKILLQQLNCVLAVVIQGNLPQKSRKDAEMYTGFVSGTIEMEKYYRIINKHDFKQVAVQ